MVLLLLTTNTVAANDNGVVSLVGFQSDLLLGLESFLLQLIDLSCEHSLGGYGRVNA